MPKFSAPGLSLDAARLAPTSAYAERRDALPAWHDRLAMNLQGWLRGTRSSQRSPRRGAEAQMLAQARQDEAACRAASDAGLQALAQQLRTRLCAEGSTPAAVGSSLAVWREVARRVIGQRAHDVQLQAAWVLLQGQLAEMATGEGKTLAAMLAAGTAALSGVPVHIITVNDYLAQRDAQTMGAVFAFCGLRTGCVVQGLSPGKRRLAYANEICYCSNKELAFDYLKDRVALGGSGGRLQLAVDQLAQPPQKEGGLLLRGLHFAIVDEADSVLIDEARTPLILSASAAVGDDTAVARAALDAAAALQADQHYQLQTRERRVQLNESGVARLTEIAASQPALPTSPRVRKERVEQALAALLLYQLDRHYVVQDGKVQIVDEFTGRLMPDRSWQAGLHQMIEAKEGCAPTPPRLTLARMTHQRLFRRYLRLAGTTGTASEVAGELWSVYALRTVRMALHRPAQRSHLPTRVFKTTDAKWQAVAQRVRELAEDSGPGPGPGRPVLLGTRSVQASEQLSAVLHAAGWAHALLNARQDADEAQVIAQAGLAGRVTVATNMAGRGTDIVLGPGVVERGGLHVILTELHASARVDRQLFGRCARQGDPGSCELMVSLEDELLRLYGAPWLGWAARIIGHRRPLADWWWRPLRAWVQLRAQANDSRQRRETLQQDARLDKALAFTGKRE